jgi:hypothetical protein
LSVLAYSMGLKLASPFSTPGGTLAAMIFRRSPSIFRCHVSLYLLMMASPSRFLSASEQTGVGVGVGVCGGSGVGFQSGEGK